LESDVPFLKKVHTPFSSSPYILSERTRSSPFSLEASNQSCLGFGMDKNYRGQKLVKSLWILPFSSSLGVLKKSFHLEYTGEFPFGIHRRKGYIYPSCHGSF
jgi:hypothetical protein